MPSSIAIIDYGMANLRSVQKAFEQVNHPADIVSSSEQVKNYDRIVLPGVGAFKDAMRILRDNGFIDPIKSHISRGRSFLGICLGLQMLFDVGYEDGEHAGMGVLPGKCIPFDDETTMNLKVPHMGWNQLSFTNPSPLFAGLADGSNVYFVHGYHVAPANSSDVAATTDYGRPFVSSIRRDNVFATQFHPEKSQKVGLRILENFATL